MKRRQFYEDFLAAGEYETPERPICSLGDRLFGWSDAWYYIRLAHVVVTGAYVAKRGRYTREKWIDQSQMTWEMVEGCRGRVHLSGLKNIADNPGPRVYVSNHMSMLETFLLPGILAPYDYTAVVVKEGLLTYPVFGHIMSAVNPISVTRQNARQDLKEVMGQGQAFLEQGRSVLIFPQHTRTPAFEPKAFNTLGTKLASRAGVPVVPIALKTDFMGIGRKFKDFGRIDRDKEVYIKVGAPIPVDGHVKEAQAAVVDYITTNFLAWGGLVKDDAERPNEEQ